jgi:oxygen-dependent protoporphyrinogen oxidase
VTSGPEPTSSPGPADSPAGRLVVVGAGIAGLAAAYAAARDGREVLVLEASDRVGGKLRLADVAGVPVDVGAEAMLNRRPEGVDLARAVGLDVVHPDVAESNIWSGGALHRLPRTLMGVPLDVEGLASFAPLSAEDVARVRAERDLPASAVDGDVSVGELVATRFGRAVVDLLVEPLLGGVYAGHADLISARAALPQLVDYATRGSVLDQAASIPTTYDAPVFAGIPGGMGRLPGAVVAAGGFEVRTGVVARDLARDGAGFQLTVGSAAAPETVAADQVVLATPAAATARLLAGVAPAAAAELGGVEAASVAVVTLALRAAHVGELPGSGFLVPPAEGRAIKASTFSFAKWAWTREAGLGRGPDGDDLLFLRTSLGRHREEATLQVSDEELVRVSLADLADAVGLRATPVDAHVQRWGGGLPQYALGHLERVARAREAVAAVPGLAVCGAAYDGVGIPAVIASAHRALAALAGR